MYKVGMMTEHVCKFGDTIFCLDTIEKLGYECADLTLFETNLVSNLNPEFAGDDYLDKTLAIKRHMNETSFYFAQAHAPFPVHKFNDEEYNKRMDFQLKRCIEICGILEIKKLVIHPFNNWNIQENTGFFNKLLPLARKNHVVICCENMWNWEKTDKVDRAAVCACSTSEIFREQINSVNSKYLKACVDIGHAQMFKYLGESPDKMIMSLDEHVACLHIHDNDAKFDLHNIPYTGTIDFRKVIGALKQIRYEGDLIIETCIPKELITFSDCCEYWKEQLAAALKIKNALTKF